MLRRWRRRPHEPSYDELRGRQAAEAGRRLGDAVERLGWSRDRLEDLRTARLRSVLTAAATRPANAERLGGLDPGRVDLSDLTRIEPTDKARTMARFDDLVTDPDVTLADAAAHLDETATGAQSHFRGRHHVLATGGTTGTRGIVVWDWDGWIEQYLLLVRRRRWLSRHAPDLLPPTGRRVNIRSRVTSHIAAANAACFELRTEGRSVSIDIGLPLDDLLDAVQRAEPGEIYSSPAMFRELARHQREERIRLDLHHLLSTSAPLGDELRAELTETFGCPVTNEYGLTETGMIAGEVPGRAPLLVDLDAAIVEVVDADDRPVPDGEVGDHLLVTNLVNHVQPIIRYRIDDAARVVPAPDAPWTADGMELVGGRRIAPFVFGEHEVNFARLEDVLIARADSDAWQVYRTERGLGVDVTGRPATEAIRQRMLETLAVRDVTDAEVTVRHVERLTPHPTSGKIISYFPHLVDWIR